VAGLVLPILPHAGHGPDSGHRQERKAGHFQPELVQDLPERMRGRAEPGEERPARPAALQPLEGQSENALDFFDRPAVDHYSILTATGRTITVGGVTTKCDVPHQRRPIPGGFVDQQLKQLMKELGEAINESLSDSESIAEVVARIKEGGYDIFLVLEATIGVSKQGEHTTDKASLVSTLSTNAELKISDQDLKFLKSLRIKIEEEED
jgi:hypothetical protein